MSVSRFGYTKCKCNGRGFHRPPNPQLSESDKNEIIAKLKMEMELNNELRETVNQNQKSISLLGERILIDGCLNAGGNRVVNVAPCVEDDDAVSLKFLKDFDAKVFEKAVKNYVSELQRNIDERVQKFESLAHQYIHQLKPDETTSVELQNE